LGLDQFVRINELELQQLGGQAADGRFAGAHEPDQSDVLDAAHGVKDKC
jgi:hypothetical protein